MMMDKQAAADILGVSVDLPLDEVHTQYERQRDLLQDRLDAAPPTLKDTFRQNLAQLEAAYQCLTGSTSNEPQVQVNDLPIAQQFVREDRSSGMVQQAKALYDLRSERQTVQGWDVFEAEKRATGEPARLRVFDQTLSTAQQQRAEKQLALWSTLRHDSIETLLDYGVTPEGVWIASYRDEALVPLTATSFKAAKSALIECLGSMASALDHMALETGHGAISMEGVRVGAGRSVLTMPLLVGVIDPNTVRSLYTAPEIKRSGMGSERADQYALAVIAAECLLAKKLDGGLIEAIEKSRLQASTKQCLKKALHDSPSQRYANCDAFVRALESSFVPTWHKVLRHRATLVLSVVAVVGVSLLVVFGSQMEAFYEEHKPALMEDGPDDQMQAVKTMAEVKDFLAQAIALNHDLEQKVNQAENYWLRQKNASRPNPAALQSAQLEWEKRKDQYDFFNGLVLTDETLTDMKSTLAVADRNFSMGEFTESLATIEPLHQRLRTTLAVGKQLEVLTVAKSEAAALAHKLTQYEHHDRHPSAKAEENRLIQLEAQLIHEGQYAQLITQVYKPLLSTYRDELMMIDASKEKRYRKEINRYIRGINETMVRVYAGYFKMGIVRAGATDARPVRKVRLQEFMVGKFPVTNQQFNRFLRHQGKAQRKPDNSPVVNVTWLEAQAYVKWLSSLSSHRYRLLTEAEWEYVARGDISTTFSWGNNVGRNNANCARCGSQWDGQSPSPVGSFKPNQFGVYDINGNVWEWVQDCYVSGYRNAPTDGKAVEFQGCAQRVVRGGAWNTDPKKLHPALRSTAPEKTSVNNLGFRIAREL